MVVFPVNLWGYWVARWLYH